MQPSRGRRAWAKESWYFVKPFNFCKLPLLLLTLGGALVLAPQARAQSEVAPDHFDGTDSWAAAAVAKVPAAKTDTRHAPAVSQARTSQPSSPALQPASSRSFTARRRSDATANSKRKPATPKSKS
jgi:hypothetical protein